MPAARQAHSIRLRLVVLGGGLGGHVLAHEALVHVCLHVLEAAGKPGARPRWVRGSWWRGAPRTFQHPGARLSVLSVRSWQRAPIRWRPHAASGMPTTQQAPGGKPAARPGGHIRSGRACAPRVRASEGATHNSQLSQPNRGALVAQKSLPNLPLQALKPVGQALWHLPSCARQGRGQRRSGREGHWDVSRGAGLLSHRSSRCLHE